MYFFHKKCSKFNFSSANSDQVKPHYHLTGKMNVFLLVVNFRSLVLGFKFMWLKNARCWALLVWSIFFPADSNCYKYLVNLILLATNFYYIHINLEKIDSVDTTFKSQYMVYYSGGGSFYYSIPTEGQYYFCGKRVMYYFQSEMGPVLFPQGQKVVEP